MREAETVTHPFDPVFDKNARALILGTMASPASRAGGFYYGHPRNRFWPLMAALFNAPVPAKTDDKKALLIQNRIALWDVLHSCDIAGASDASIQKPTAEKMSGLFAVCPGLAVFANGQTAARLYRRLVYPDTGVPIVPLPSTSPANAAWTLERLIEAWKIVRN